MKTQSLTIFTTLFLTLSGLGLMYSSPVMATDNTVREELPAAATANFAIQNMTCAACPITVNKAMSRVDGVKQVKIDFKTKIARVTFDANVTTADQIGAASTNVGYPATLIGSSE